MAITFFLSGCALFQKSDLYLLQPIHGVEVLNANRLADIEKYQAKYTFISQIKSPVFLNNKNLLIRANNLNANVVVILTLEEKFKFSEYYIYYFFRTQSSSVQVKQ
jgi:hypothetical protein